MFHVFLLLFLFLSYSPDVNMSWPNPLVNMDVTWTEEMVSDLRRRFDEAKGFIPVCFWVRIVHVADNT